MILWHGNTINHDKILDEGLYGGFNQCGGTHGCFDEPLLFTSPNPHVAKKYGELIKITIPDGELANFDYYKTNDGLGDSCYVFRGDGIVIAPEYLSSPLREWQNGACSYDEDSPFCKECGECEVLLEK